MTTSKKIWIGVGIASAIALVFVSIWGAKQWKKFQKNVIGFKSFLIRKITPNEVVFEVVMSYYNDMDFDIELVSQKYDISLDGIYTTTLTNHSYTKLQSKTTSTIPLQIAFDPKVLLKNLSGNLNALLDKEAMKNIQVTIDMDLKIKFGILKIPFSYSYTDTIKHMAGLK